MCDAPGNLGIFGDSGDILLIRFKCWFGLDCESSMPELQPDDSIEYTTGSGFLDISCW